MGSILSDEEYMLVSDEDRDVGAGETSFGWTRNGFESTDSHTSLPVYENIHMIRDKILSAIEEPLTSEQLNSPAIALSTVEPLADGLYDVHDISLVFCLLANRVHFLREYSSSTQHQMVNIARALLCELLASKMLQRYAANSQSELLLLLSKILVTDFDFFQNAPDTVKLENRQTLSRDVGERDWSGMKSTALELAIISKSKSFLCSLPCQKVIDAIHKGKVVYTPFSPIDVLPDHYKRRPVCIYDPKKAPLLNQYRLIVPRTRYILEICQFCLLLLTYFLTMVYRDGTRYTWCEAGFSLYAFGWVLDQFASVLEHGWQVYTQNLWSFLDVIFVLNYGTYLILRSAGAVVQKTALSRLALDILATAAPVLVPRLAFNLMSNNTLIVALREMMADFSILSLLAIWCSGGFLLAMTWLSNGAHDSTTVSKWMLWVWFGLDGTGIEKSVDFHKFLGPILMIAFAFLGNTLFLTLLVAMLSHDFSTIVVNAAGENQYRRAVMTFGGVKSDSLFSYPPPFNILAVVFLLPLKFIVSPRWFHKINVAAIRTLNAPLLLAICLYERRHLWDDTKGRSLRSRGQSYGTWGLSRFSVYVGIQAVFHHEPRKSSDSIPCLSRPLYNACNGEILTRRHNPWKISRTSKVSKIRVRSRRTPLNTQCGLMSCATRSPTTLYAKKELKQRTRALEASCSRVEAAIDRLCDRLAETESRI